MSRIEVRQITQNAYVTLKSDDKHPGLDNTQHFPVLNVSPGGIRIESAESFAIGEKIDLSLYLNGELSHSARGRVCYCDDKSNEQHIYYGISFLDKFIHLHH